MVCVASQHSKLAVHLLCSSSPAIYEDGPYAKRLDSLEEALHYGREASGWEIPLQLGVVKAAKFKPVKNVNKVLAWLGDKKCRMDLKKPFQPNLKLVHEVEEREEGDESKMR